MQLYNLIEMSTLFRPQAACSHQNLPVSFGKGPTTSHLGIFCVKATKTKAYLLRKLVQITSQCIFWSNLIKSMHHPLTTLDCDKTIAAPATCKLYLVSSENIPGNVARCRGPCQAPNKAPSGGTGALTFGSPVWEFVHPWYSCAREFVQPRWKRVGGSMVWYLLALPPHPATI